MLPVVALVGRPNVGKSTLFNRLTRTRDAIVADFPGLTRDRQYGQGKVGPCAYIVVDTGGFEPVRSEGIVREMAGQAEAAIAEADVVIFVCDARSGLTPHDERIARHLRSAGRPIFLAVNKSEGLDDSHVAEFHELGLGDPWRISAAHGQGVSGLLQTVLEPFVNAQDEEETEETDPDAPKRIKVTVAGRPNVGKSTLINALLGEERLIAYDMPGTTRDAIKTEFEYDGRPFELVDTAGLRTTDDTVERMGIERAYASVARAQIVLQVFDAADPAVESLDLRPDQCRILVANKIDRIDPAAAPVSLPDGALPLSAREGRGMEQLLERLRAAVDASALDDGRTIVSNSRHYEALHHARTALDAALGGLETLPSDLLGEEIRQAIFHLGTITGEITTDEVLDQIFSKFCIGK